MAGSGIRILCFIMVIKKKANDRHHKKGILKEWSHSVICLLFTGSSYWGQCSQLPYWRRLRSCLLSRRMSYVHYRLRWYHCLFQVEVMLSPPSLSQPFSWSSFIICSPSCIYTAAFHRLSWSSFIMSSQSSAHYCFIFVSTAIFSDLNFYQQFYAIQIVNYSR